MEYIKAAISNIKQNKGRTVLTMLGIIIGISSVITILSIGNGMRASLNESLDNLTNGAVTIQIDTKKTNKYLTDDNIAAIDDAVSQIKGATPSITVYGSVTLRNTVGVRIFAGNTDYINEFDMGIASGRFYNESDIDSASAVCVLTEASAIYLYGSTNVCGMTLPVDFGAETNGELTVIGVLRSTEDEISGARSILAADELGYIWADIYVPYTMVTDRFILADNRFTAFKIYPFSGLADEAAARSVAVAENILDVRGENAVRVQSFASFAEMYSKILSAVTLVIALIAAISLLVGGIGVMNIMTVTVTERTREIGIRKSLGARTSYIMLQFLTESAAITLLGGMIGIMLGFILSRIIGSLVDINAIILPRDVVIVVAISTAIGLFFGMYPARKAAHLNPIDALRTE